MCTRSNLRRFWVAEALACNEASAVERCAEGCDEAGECVRRCARSGGVDDERRGAQYVVLGSSRGVMA